MKFFIKNKGALVLYAAFAGTGIGLVLPGTLLPRLLVRWAMSDSHAGLLLFLFSAGSIVGALLSRGNLRLSLVRGCLVSAAGLVALAHATRTLAFPAAAVYGCGLGLVMTSVSMLEAQRHVAARAAQLTRLNLVWAVGACCGPWMLLRGSERAGTTATLYTLSVCFVCIGLVALVALPATLSPGTQVASPKHAVAPQWLLLAMVPLATGVESAAGGWLATFARRSGQTLSGTIAETTCLWAGLLLSRAALSNKRVAAACAGALLWICPAVIAAALALLLLSTARSGMVAGALLLGLGVGPVYPALLARVLRRGETSTAAFALAGIGASTLPLATGVVSGWSGSLRVGLCVPLVAAVAMAGCGVMNRATTVEEPSS